MAGLKRRKLALEMLGNAVQSGLNKRDAEAKRKAATNTAVLKTQEVQRKAKRSLEEAEEGEKDDVIEEPLEKKVRTET